MGGVVAALLAVGCGAVLSRSRRGEERLREKLDEQRRRLETLVGNLPGVAYRCRATAPLSFDFVSAGCRELTGYTAEELGPDGRVTFGELVHSDDRPRVLRLIQRALDERRQFTVTFRIRCADGTVKWIWDRGVGIYDDGRVVAVEGFASDVTEQILEERRRSQLQREAQAAIQARERFLAMASHDLRTPLAALRLRVQQEKRRAVQGRLSAPELGRDLEKVEQQVARLEAFIDELLEASKVSAGRLEIRREEVDLAVLVRELVEQLSPRLEASGCEVRVDLPGSLPGIWDLLRLEQVVTNLLSNACKYGAGRPVTVRLERIEGGARLLVRDAGEGLEPAELERLFRPYERLSDRHRLGSTGLGLWITRSIVEAMGGRIYATSEGRGKGSTFVVELPRALARGDSGRHRAVQSQAGGTVGNAAVDDG